MIGITESNAALPRWMVAGPEIATVLLEYEGKISKQGSSNKHHEQ
jgi:hypothetical protein